MKDYSTLEELKRKRLGESIITQFDNSQPIEKAIKNKGNLVQKVITDKNGHSKKVWVKKEKTKKGKFNISVVDGYKGKRLTATFPGKRSITDNEETEMRRYIKQEYPNSEHLSTHVDKYGVKSVYTLKDLKNKKKDKGLDKLLKKYNFPKEAFERMAEAEQYTDKERNDLDYMEDRIETYLDNMGVETYP